MNAAEMLTELRSMNLVHPVEWTAMVARRFWNKDKNVEFRDRLFSFGFTDFL
jgi:hypothetical protein